MVGCRDDFDFTVAFEESFLAITPSACFVVLALCRIWYLSRQPRIVSASGLQLLKLVGPHRPLRRHDMLANRRRRHPLCFMQA